MNLKASGLIKPVFVTNSKNENESQSQSVTALGSTMTMTMNPGVAAIRRNPHIKVGGQIRVHASQGSQGSQSVEEPRTHAESVGEPSTQR